MSRKQRIPPEVNRILYVRNLPPKVTSEEMYDIFGEFGGIRQIRRGNAHDSRGTAFVVYEDIYGAKAALEALNGFNVAGRYLIILYYSPARMQAKTDLKKKQQEIDRLRRMAAKNEEE
ncbi:pre-mRNA branch site protein p14 [Acrasis kona]|uniref:Pre-mRNA branch site protein p14 n=1 Tax=Acrasis kona TaxID=1008807 RepID=A0AAW2YJ67_9EUKA